MHDVVSHPMLQSDYVGVCACEACRKLLSIVHNLHDQLSDLLKVTKANDALSQDEISKLKTENGNLRTKINQLEEINDDLRKLISTLTDSSAHSASWSKSDHDVGTPWPLIPTSNRFSVLQTMADDTSEDNHLPHINSRVSPNPRLHRTSPTPHSNRMAPKDKAPTQNPRPHRQSRSHHPHHGDPKDNVPTTVTVVGSSIVRGVAPLVNGREFDAVGFYCPGR